MFVLLLIDFYDVWCKYFCEIGEIKIFYELIEFVKCDGLKFKSEEMVKWYVGNVS